MAGIPANDSDILYDGLETETIGYIYMVTSILVTISNIVVMVVVFMSKELHSPSLWNIAFMAFCDCSFGLNIIMVNVPSAFQNQFAYPESLAIPAASINSLLYGQNLLNILLATFDRFLSVCFPLRYQQLMNPKRFGVALLVTIVINVCRCLLILVPGGEVVFSTRIAFMHVKYEHPISILAATGMPFLIFLITSIVITYLIVDISRSQRQVQADSSDHVGRQLTVTIVLSATLFCLAYIPTCTCIVWSFMKGRLTIPNLLAQFSMFTLLSNSLWNVVIYAVTYRPFRDAAMRLFCKTIYRRQRQNELNRTFQGGIGHM